jgi:Txe/YoeB family toxin of toxin-antitoxin system
MQTNGMLNYYIHTPAINSANPIKDISELMNIKQNMSDKDILHRYSDIYNSPVFDKLYSLGESNGLAVNAILKFIGGCKSIDQIIENEKDCFQKRGHWPVGFLGFDFTTTMVSADFQIFNVDTYKSTKKKYLQNPNYVSDDIIPIVLKYLYSSYDFSNDAIADVVSLKHGDCQIYEKLFSLLDDISQNPFTGGLGKTEVLRKNDGVASKRLTQEDRIRYKAEAHRFTIFRCREHYE